MIRHVVWCFILMIAVTSLGAEEVDQYGKSHQWHGDTGKLLVIDFAASWCGPCRKALPRLEKFATEHPALRVLVISVDESEEGRDRLVESLGLTLPVLWDQDFRIAEHYAPKGMPSTLVIDSEGAVIYSHVGAGSKQWSEFVTFFKSLAEE